MHITRRHLIKDTILYDGKSLATKPVTRVAACAVVLNPFAGIATDDLGALVPLGAELGELLASEANAALPNPACSYGKAAIIGIAGELEHGAAIIHPSMGKPMRKVVGGGQAIIPSNVKIGSAGATIDVPLGHKDDVWSFDEIDTMTIALAGSPRPDEILVIIVLADGGRPRPRVSKIGVVPPKTA